MAIASKSIQTLDAQLDAWEKRTDIISQALLQLHDLPIYQQLSAAPPPDVKIRAILQESQQLYEQFDQLLQVLHRARQCRDESAGLLSSNQGRTTAYRLLNESSVPVVLASGSGASGGPISEKKMTPEEAIALLICRCKAVTAALHQSQTDLDQQAAQLRQHLAQAQRDLAQSEATYRSAQLAQQEYEQKIAPDDEPLPPPLLAPDLVRQTLAALVQNSANPAGATASAIELQQWQQQQKQSQQALDSALLFYQKRLNLRQELRGRLRALQAKAQAQQKIEQPVLSQLAQAAERSLYSRPTSLQQAETLVKRYEQQLNQR